MLIRPERYLLRRSAWWPAQFAAADHVQVKVRHGVAGVIADVEHQAVPTVESLGVGYLVGKEEHVGDYLGVLGAKLRRILDMTAGNDKDMARGDRSEVPEGDRVVAGADLIGRHLAGDDSAEDAGRHPEANLLPDDAAARFIWDARNSEAARARAREHWIRQQAREGATFEGILRALSERGGSVEVRTSDGGREEGTVLGVSAELVELATGDTGRTWLVRAGLAAVSPLVEGFDVGVASDDRGPSSSATLAGLLAGLAEERSPVTIRSGGQEVTGRLVGAGADVLTLRLSDGGLTYLPVSGVSLLRLS